MAEAGAAECLAEEDMVEVLEDQLFGAAEVDLVVAVLVAEVQAAAEVLVDLAAEVSAEADQAVAGSYKTGKIS